MWERSYIKSRAKEVLRITYWKAFVVSFVLLLVGANGGGGNSGGRANSSNSAFNQFTQHNANWLMIGLIILLGAILFRVLIGYAVEVGGRRFFVRAAQMDVNMGYLGYAFKGESYTNIILTMLYRAVLNFLWFLLLIIPGIVKSYAYSMVPYILADNPNIGYSRAVQLSVQMTEGHKLDMFVLDLSFIGWFLLGSLLLFVGALFVYPYVDATKAELYLILRQNALDNNYCSYDELLLTPNS